MIGRVVAEIVVLVVLAAVLVVTGFAVLELGDGSAPAEAFLDGGPRTAIGLVGIGFGVWALATTVGGLLARRRPARIRVLISILAGLAGALVNVIVWTVVASGGGWAMLAVAFALIGSIALVVAIVVATLVVHLVLFRAKQQA